MRVFNLFIAVVVAISVIFVAEAIAQMQAPPPAGQKPSAPGVEKPAAGDEKTIQGQVRSIDSSEREITLVNGTKLVVPEGASIRPGVLKEGTTVIASYREENGKNVLTALAVAQDPSASPPS